MSQYQPIASRKLFGELRRRGLILPRAGDPLFLTDAHRQMERELSQYHEDLAKQFHIPPGLIDRWTHYGEAANGFLSEMSHELWAEIYGVECIDDLGEMLFGRNIRLELLRSRGHRRRFLVVGPRGSARPLVGDRLRYVVSEYLVGKLGFSSGAQKSLSMRFMGGVDSGRQALFGNARRRLNDDSHPGVLLDNQHCALFLDGLLGADEATLYPLMELLDAGVQHRASTQADFHLIVGAQPAQIQGNSGALVQTLFQFCCRDGLLDLPPLGKVLRQSTRWKSLFELVYAEVARAECGLAVRPLHSLPHQDTPEAASLNDESVELESDSFLNWITNSQRMDAIQKTVQPIFADYTWPGDLREFEALIRQMIRSQDTPELSIEGLKDVAVRFRRRQPVADDNLGRQSDWLVKFAPDLEPLPLVEESLPKLLANVEAKYLAEAARQASLQRAPKPARIQDVARILGIPRQTASRKWESHNLPATLLTDDASQ